MSLKDSASGRSAWSKKKIVICSIIALVIVALGVGLGAGLGVGLKKHGSDDDDTSKRSGDVSDTDGRDTSGGDTKVSWQPAVGVRWQIQLSGTLSSTDVDADVYDIDLFENSNETIAELQGMGRRVICYFSAGSSETTRPDSSEFKDTDQGKVLDGWPDEKWLDLKSTNVRKIMQGRLDLAKSKGCDGVDPDNVDGYDNENGLGLTQADAIDYVKWLADKAHNRGLSMGLKNAGAIIGSVIKEMQWSVNEQCAEFDECDIYAAFTRANKPVFHIEYPKGDDTNNNDDVTTEQKKKACTANAAGKFSTVIKNMNLDYWVEYCS